MTAASSPAAEAVLALAASRPPTLGGGRLVCVDGPAGSGKTTLAGELAAPVVHLDDLYQGWSGLSAVEARVDRLLRPLAEGRAGDYRRWSWTDSAWAETVTVPPAPLLVLEGVGSWARSYAGLVTVLVWVEAPADLRLQRGLERDGPDLAGHWERWMREEQAHLARQGTRDHADLVVDGSGR